MHNIQETDDKGQTDKMESNITPKHYHTAYTSMHNKKTNIPWKGQTLLQELDGGKAVYKSDRVIP